jgi:cytoplasmic iron level regulating protein YaaA (DUF328/UPF0246 family)
MLILLSPSKTLNFEEPSPTNLCTTPDFLDFSDDLIKGLSKLSIHEIELLMKLSPNLAKLNHLRFQEWTKEHNPGISKQALVAFKGDVYDGLRAWEFKDHNFKFAQANLRILSGLYGILKPLDLIQPYRLEMGTVYANPAGKDLYSFWGDKLAEAVQKDLKQAKSKIIVNLASLEYSKAARLNQIDAEVISPVFKDEKNGNFKIISFYAKRARGLMANFIITNQIEDPANLTDFSSEGYTYSLEQSKPTEPVFLRAESKRSAA